jgi:hypothetical protein
VIPTMILLGLVLGRWMPVAFLAAAVGWPLLLVASGVVAPDDGQTLATAAVLAVINAAVGVVTHQVCLLSYRLLRYAFLRRRVTHALAG